MDIRLIGVLVVERVKRQSACERLAHGSAEDGDMIETAPLAPTEAAHAWAAMSVHEVIARACADLLAQLP